MGRNGRGVTGAMVGACIRLRQGHVAHGTRWRVSLPSQTRARQGVVGTQTWTHGTWASLDVFGAMADSCVLNTAHVVLCQGSSPSSSSHPHLRLAVPIFVQPSPSSSSRPHLRPPIPIFIRPDHPHRPVCPVGPTGPYRPLSYSLHELSYVLFP